MDVEPPLALPPPPPPEDEWRPIPEHTNVNGKVDILESLLIYGLSLLSLGTPSISCFANCYYLDILKFRKNIEMKMFRTYIGIKQKYIF